MKITKKQIDKVLDGFDFESAAKVYKLFGWKWFSKGIPNSDDLREEAIRLLGDLAESDGPCSIRCGGLKVSKYYYDESRLIIAKLEFIAVSSAHDNLDEE